MGLMLNLDLISKIIFKKKYIKRRFTLYLTYFCKILRKSDPIMGFTVAKPWKMACDLVV